MKEKASGSRVYFKAFFSLKQNKKKTTKKRNPTFFEAFLKRSKSSVVLLWLNKVLVDSGLQKGVTVCLGSTAWNSLLNLSASHFYLKEQGSLCSVRVVGLLDFFNAVT